MYLYSARIHQTGAQGALHQAHKSFLKPSQLPVEYTAQLLPYWRIGLLINYNNHLTGTLLLQGGEKQLWSSVLLKDTCTMVAARIGANVLKTQPLERKIWCTEPLGHGTHLRQSILP